MSPPRLARLLLACALAAACGGETAEEPGGEPGPQPDSQAEVPQEALPAPAPQAESAGLPAIDSIVVITLDTTRADALGAYGQSLPSSPQMDAMAAEGVLFEQVVSASPSTFPSHATIFTGRMPYAHGVRSNAGYQLSPANLTLAELLAARGFRTHAEVAAPVLDASKRLDQGFEHYRDPRTAMAPLDGLEEFDSPRPRLGTRPAEEITEAGLAFLDEHAGAPFFLWLHYFDPHNPRMAPEPFRSRLPDPYLAEVARVDHQVGRVLERIRALGLRRRAVVALTADHGEGLGQHGEPTHSVFVYDTTLRVPLLLWGAPALPRGARVAPLVRTADLMPTLLELVGAPLPGGLEGRSLLPLLRRPGRDPGHTAYAESVEPVVVLGGDVLRTVRRGPWKYIHEREPKLFDVIEDPGELDNRAAREPERVAALRARLGELIAAAPPRPEDSEVPVDAESVAQLQALGYLGGGAVPLADELASLELRGPDPSTRVEDIGRVIQGWSLLVRGEYAAGEELFSQALESTPESDFAFYGLVETLRFQRAEERLIPLLRQGIERDPIRAPEYRRTLASLLHSRGEASEAEALLREVLAADPCEVEARLVISEVLRGAGRHGERIAVLEQGPSDCPHAEITRNALAFALASAPDPALRDGERALALARKAVEATGGRHPDYLDTLAAACAELGDFECAVREQRRALALFEGREVPEEVVESFRRHLEQLVAGRPIRDPGGSTP